MYPLPFLAPAPLGYLFISTAVAAVAYCCELWMPPPSSVSTSDPLRECVNWCHRGHFTPPDTELSEEEVTCQLQGQAATERQSRGERRPDDQKAGLCL